MSSSHKYDKFLHPISNVLYAYLEVPIAFLEKEIPESANWSEKEDKKQKTIGEYVLSKCRSNDDSKAVILLSASECEGFRNRGYTYDDLQDWETWLDTEGYSIDDYLTTEEVSELINGIDYYNIEISAIE